MATLDSDKKIKEMIHNKNKRKMDKNTAINAGLAGANADTVRRYGSAYKEHSVAYSGIDNETGEQLSKSLKKIFGYKINPEYEKSNINQQAGYCAEVKVVARDNAEKAIRGEETKRAIRTDDMIKQSDGKGNNIGHTNDQLYDFAEVDKNGIHIKGSERQLKFVGENSTKCAEKLLSKDYNKFRDKGAPIEVPSDFYEGVQKELESKSENYRKQINASEKKGNLKTASKKREMLERTEETKKLLRKSSVSKEEAIEARLNPELSTKKDTNKILHRSGTEAAKNAAMIGGGISLIRNLVAVIKGAKKPTDAVIDVTKDTAVSGGLGYTTGLFGAAIKGTMQNSQTKFLRGLSKTNLPAIVVAITWETSKTLARYANSEIDGTDCLTELGEKGTGMLASAGAAAIGQALIPIPIVGGLVGGMAGYAMSSSYYNELVNALKDAKLAREERLQVEAECRETINAIKEYRSEIELVINNYLQEQKQIFDSALSEIETAYNTDDADGFIKGTNQINKKLGGKPLFESKKEFDEIMKNPTVIRIEDIKQVSKKSNNNRLFESKEAFDALMKNASAIKI